MKQFKQLSRADRLEIALMTPAQRSEAIAVLRRRLVTLAVLAGHGRMSTVPLSRTERQRLLDQAEAASEALRVLELVDRSLRGALSVRDFGAPLYALGEGNKGDA